MALTPVGRYAAAMSAGFAYETDLCEALASQLALIRCDQVRVRRELHVGAEIPDVVLTLCERASAPRISAIESAVLAHLIDGAACDTNSVAGELFTQQERVVSALKRLARLGFVAESAPDLWSLSALDLQSARVIAIEAKLTRWQDALAQAISYRRFANLSFVALPLSVLQRRRDEFRADCERNEIGLIGVAPSQIWIEVAAPAHEPRTADWIWTVLRTRLNETRRTCGTRSTSCADGSSLFAR
jgi:hypothetical protein